MADGDRVDAAAGSNLPIWHARLDYSCGNRKPASKSANQLRLALLALLMALLDFFVFSPKLVSPKRHAICENHGGTMWRI
jgi:hypothetical protein